MKKYTPLFALALAALLAVLLTACASGQQQKQAPTRFDSAYVNAVESAAYQVGVDVYWINPPRKPRVILDDEG